MKKSILLSIGMIVFVGAVVVSATGAFFSDTETSTGNVFTAGSIDLKIDSTATLNGEPVSAGTWNETDLGAEHRFFDYNDLKPGDEGENTISLHVYSNDAWGRFVVSTLTNSENSCTEPELEAEVDCDDDDVGELADQLTFTAWLDQGETPGFQGKENDPGEGDNIWQDDDSEPMFWNGDIASMGSWDIKDVLSAAYSAYCSETDASADGHNNYELCHGLAEDGRMVGSTTYYFGLAWELPPETGNDTQTDSLSATMAFEVEQWRNNPSPSWED